MAKRLKFQCWKCDREYEKTRETVDKPELLVACPYCFAKGEVDLNRYRGPEMGVQRGDDPAAADTLNLPAVIPTEARD